MGSAEKNIKPSTVKQSAFAALVVMVFCARALATENPVDVVLGKAYDLKTNQLVYTEEHHFLPSYKHKVVYREPDGAVFGEKMIDYGDSATAPDVVQSNSRVGEKISFVRNSDKTLQAEYRLEQNRKQKAAEIRLDESLVIDAGFNNFIKQNWQALEQGDSLEFDYLVPTRLSRVKLMVERAACENPQSMQQSCFQIKPANRLIALVLQPILLHYNASSKSLLEFRGRSNIAQENGKYHQVRIVYAQLAASGVNSPAQNWTALD